MSWHEAIRAAGDGCHILLETTAGARHEAFPSGYNAWRGRIGIAVAAPAHAGKANRAVIALVAAALQVPRRDVAIVAGATDGRKTVAVAGLAAADARRRLAPALD